MQFVAMLPLCPYGVRPLEGPGLQYSVALFLLFTVLVGRVSSRKFLKGMGGGES